MEIISQLLQISSTESNRIYALTSHTDRLKNRYGDRKNLVILRREDFLKKKFFFRDIDILVNCAFPRKADGTQMAEGLKYVSEILSMAVSGGVKSVINISSQSVYDQTRIQPATEQDELNLGTKYAVGKYATELLTNTICVSVPHTNLRLASLIGAGFNERIPNKFVEQIVCGNDLHVINGGQRFGFLDVRDAADAIIVIINSNPRSWREVYNLGSNESHTLEEIAKEVCRVGEKYCNKTIQYKLMQGDNAEPLQNSSMDCTLYRKAFQWKPKIRLTDTLAWIYEEVTGHYAKD